MEMLTILLFIVIILLILSQQSKILKHFDRLEEDIRRLRDQLDHSQSQVSRPAEPDTKPEWKPASPIPAPVARPIPDAPVPPPIVETPGEIRNPGTQEAKDPLTRLADPTPHPQRIDQYKEPPHPPIVPQPKKGFFDRHPDLEKFIGENLISKIGIAILVLAIGFFVKYEIDNGKIGPVGRVGIGLLCGGILVALAHVLRKSYAAFSSVLVGGGLAIFYFTITLAYHQYALFSQSMAFVIMLVITAFAVILSMLYDRQELAIIALVGGFAAPFMVSTGSGNYQVLFSYLLILNTGLLVIAYNKAWRLLNLLAFLFTAALFISWLATLPDNTGTAAYRGGFLFATAFYILFFAINIAHTIKENKKFIASDFGILLANTCFYFGIGLWLLNGMGLGGYRGLFSASMGVFNLAGSYFLLRKRSVDSNILYLLIGITLSFVSLTAPLQLHGHYITLFWASETVLLYWLSQKAGIRIIKWASMGVWVAMLLSLLMDWGEAYDMQIVGQKTAYVLPVIFNKGFMTGIYSALACYALFFLQRREDKRFSNIARTAFLLIGTVVLFTTGALEIDYQFTHRYEGSELNELYLLLYTFGFIFLLTIIGGKRSWFRSPWTIPALLAACMVTYLIFIPDSFRIQRGMLEEGHYSSHFLAHWISALLIAMILYRLIALRPWRRKEIDPVFFTWIAGILVVAFLSAEIQLLVNACFYSPSYPLPEIQSVYYKTGLPILWGLCSFSFMWLGMRHKFKPLRILSLVLFSITLLKLFFFDIRNIPVAGKIAAFFCLGVLLLVVSFMYQRLKKIIVADEEKKIV
jgi:uncharacterized membrane protein